MSGDYLPLELVIQILSWLPPKSLLRFRCVCKSWCSLISSPNFIDIHTRNLTYITNTRKLIRHCTTTSLREEVYSVRFDNHSTFERDDDVKLDFPFTSRTKYRIVGSCNGLICLTDDSFRGYAIKIVLWNPAIRRKLTVPLPDIILENMGYIFALGFGFDCKANDYKIVRLSYKNCHMLPPLVEVYSVKTGAWRGISAPAPVCHMTRITGYFWRQGFVNGLFLLADEWSAGGGREWGYKSTRLLQLGFKPKSRVCWLLKLGFKPKSRVCWLRYHSHQQLNLGMVFNVGLI